EISAVAATAEALAGQVAEAIEEAARTAGAGGEEERSALVAAELASARAQVVTSRLVPEAATRLFDALGASAVRETSALDRHWRNARTVASHNPWVYKAREIGAFEVNGPLPGFQWAIGTVSIPAGERGEGAGPVPFPACAGRPTGDGILGGRPGTAAEFPGPGPP